MEKHRVWNMGGHRAEGAWARSTLYRFVARSKHEEGGRRGQNGKKDQR